MGITKEIGHAIFYLPPAFLLSHASHTALKLPTSRQQLSNAKTAQSPENKDSGCQPLDPTPARKTPTILQLVRMRLHAPCRRKMLRGLQLRSQIAEMQSTPGIDFCAILDGN